MSTFKDIYDILKDLMNEAKALKNQEMITLAMDLQSKLFDFKEEIEIVRDENKDLKEEINRLKTTLINEEDISYTENGFFTLKKENNRIPYCSACFRIDKKIVPLAKGMKAWSYYTCPCCKTDISISDAYGNDLLKKE